MKPSIYRRLRRRPAFNEAANAGKENKQEQSFFGEALHEPFFKPVTAMQQAATVQRKCADCEKEDKVQRAPEKKEEEKKVMKKEDKKEEEKKVMKKEDKKEEEKVMKKEEKKEEEKVMKKEDKKEEDKVQKKESATSSTNSTATASNYISSINGKGQSMDAGVQSFYENRIGADFSDVKIHTGKEAADSAKDINAQAYAYGNNIVFNEGKYKPETSEGKKLMAHELVHVMQQENEKVISRKDETETEAACTAGSVDLEAETNATYKKGAGTAKNEVTKKGKGCDGCDDDSCISVTGKLAVPYTVATNINLPPVSSNLTPCQQDRVRTAINTKLLPHEKQHVKAFETFNGTASLAINYHGCADDYVSYQEGLADTEFERRKTAADTKSAALDPFTVPVDLCCKDKPKK